MDTKGPLPSSAPPYMEQPQGQHVPYGFSVGPQPLGPYSQPPGPPAYNSHQFGYTPVQPGYPPAQHSQPLPMPGYPGTQVVQSVSHPGQTHTVTVQPRGNEGNTVIIVGGCPTCRAGQLEDNYTCCGICCAIFFFPVGILCCLAMKEKKCQNCKATF